MKNITPNATLVDLNYQISDKVDKESESVVFWALVMAIDQYVMSRISVE
jgi:hypothetical protein